MTTLHVGPVRVACAHGRNAPGTPPVAPDMNNIQDFNSTVINEFRAKGGTVTEAAPFGDGLVLLHSTGAKSGRKRINPLASPVIHGTRVLIASKAGAPDNPDWFHNLVANPEASIEVGVDGEVVEQPVVARVAEPAERDRLFEAVKQWSPGFADYEAKTDRVIPVVVLDPA